MIYMYTTDHEYSISVKEIIIDMFAQLWETIDATVGI